ncbi:LysR family transcriptional regulator [Serratia entomophila]|nr:LysR family transcriptional regulator [Serratia entomophila]
MEINSTIGWPPMRFSERLKGIDVFVCVADAGSFTAAAERLHLTTSAVSKSVARLEKRLKVKLFDRTTRRLALNDAGVEFYRACTGALAHLEEVELSLHAEHQELKGGIRIDLPAAYGRLQVLPVILQFMREHPQLEPHITLSDRFVDPVEEGIDIIVRSGGRSIWPAALGHYQMNIQRLVFCASPGYLQRHGEPGNEHELSEHALVFYGQGNGMAYPLHFTGERQENILRPASGGLAIGDSEGQALAVMAGFGIGQLPTWLIREPLADGRLVKILPELETDGMPITLAWLKNREKLPKVKALIERLIASCGE